MQIINLTPHSIKLVDKNGNVIKVWNKCENPARCKQETIYVTNIGDVPISKTKFGEVYDLPPPNPATLYIVSRFIMIACPERQDLLVPNEIYRTRDGVVQGCQSFAVN